MATAIVLCKIPANPDIAGIGVRIAIYVQNLLCFIPAFWALVDGKVTETELESAETQATTNLVLAFAILISAMVQATTLGLTSYHASIVLNMSWMNNTNTFIYFLLYVQHKSQTTLGSDVKPTFSAWAKHIRDSLASVIPGANPGEPEQVIEGASAGSDQDVRQNDEQVITLDARTGAKVLVKRFVLLLGSLHLSLMAGLGLWLWSDIRDFGNMRDTANNCAAEHA
ncbi:hypothetical protein DFP72DRAFT_999693, partial [Ephemerocybe angulata]